MLDVHLPEHRIQGFRDFALHLLTITVGLLIALGLEASVEALHHRHQREEAEGLIRRELRGNLDKLHEGAPEVMGELEKMTGVVQILSARTQSQPGALREGDLGFHEGAMQDAAWRTANSTGAVAYMDYGEVGRFSDAYKEQALLQTMEEQALEDYLELGAILSHNSDAGVVSPETAKDALPYARRIAAHRRAFLPWVLGRWGRMRRR